MGRIPLPGREALSPEQLAVYDAVVSGPRGTIIGPLRAAIHSPALARRWSALGESLRFQTTLPKRVTELAIIVTGRRWTSQVEWWVHAKAALEAGIPAAAIAAIQVCGAPMLGADDLIVYEFARHLQEGGQAPLPVYRAVEARWGVRGVVELTAVIGYYTMVSMTLNNHEIPLPDGVEAPLAAPEGGGLARLSPGVSA